MDKVGYIELWLFDSKVLDAETTKTHFPRNAAVAETYDFQGQSNHDYTYCL